MPLEDLELYNLDGEFEGNQNSLEATLALLPAQIPDRWKNFLLVHPRPTFFDGKVKILEDMAFLSRGFVELDVIYGLNDGHLGITDAYETYKGRVMHGLIPIAGPVPGGDHIFYASGPLETGKVFYWWHEAPCSENSRESLCLIANSLDDFFDKIEPLEDI